MKISFVIPVYNEFKTLEKAIHEVIELTDIEKEIIIVDNNSNDGSRDIIKKFLNYKNFKVVLKDENLGYGDSIKQAINLSTGDFIYIQYADLEYKISGFHAMLNCIQSNNVDFVFGERYEKLSYSKAFKIIFHRPSFLGTFITTAIINFFYKKNFNDIIGSKLYKTNQIKKIKVNSDGQGFDFELVSKINKYNYNVKCVLIPYTPRSNSKEKKIKFYHMFVALYQILRVKFFIK